MSAATDALPNGWEQTNLGDVVEILDRLRIPVNSSERQRRQGNVPYFGATGQVGWINDYLFDAEIVLLGEDGAPFLDQSKSKAYMVRGKSWVNNHAHVLKGTDAISNSFLLHQLNTIDYSPFVSGTTRLKLPQAPMRLIPLRVPPLAEQHRIVAEIETQLTRLEAAVAALKRAQANLKRYRAAVLKAACEGRLVASEETTDGLELQDQELLRPADMSKHDFVIPTGWRAALLSEITIKIGDVDHNMPKAVESGIPYVSTKDFIELNEIDYTNAKRISAEDFNKLSRKIKPERGDLLISRYGTIGQIRLITFDQPFQASYSSAIVKTGSDLILTSFLVQVLRSEIGQSQMRKEIRASSQPDLGLESIRNLLIPFPDIETQSRIVVEIDRRNSLLDDMEKTVSHGLKRAERLRQAILRKAFAGELVPQDPDDEPASVLLERIRAERAAAVPVKNGGRARRNAVQLRLE